MGVATVRVFWMIAALVVVAAGTAVWLARRPANEGASSPAFRLVEVTRGPFELSVTATGVIGPINRVEIKSKASGQVVELPVEAVNVKVTSTDGLGALGRGEGIAAQAIVLLRGPEEDADR